jgi:PAS domain S-box-containing protein
MRICAAKKQKLGFARSFNLPTDRGPEAQPIVVDDVTITTSIRISPTRSRPGLFAMDTAVAREKNVHYIITRVTFLLSRGPTMMRPVKSNDRARMREILPTRDSALWRETIRRFAPKTRTIMNLVLFSTAFYLAYVYGMSFHHNSSAPFWPPDAILLCALLLTPWRRWWLYLIVTLPIRLSVAVPPDISIWFLLAVYANDSLKAIISAALLKRINHGPPRLESMQELFLFFTVAVLSVPMLSAFAGAATRMAIGDSYWAAWQRWFLGNALANLLLTPMILYWIIGAASALQFAGIKRFIEGILLIAALILVGFIAMSGAIEGLGNSSELIYLPFPLLLYSAVRFGPRGVSSALSLMAAIIIWNAEQGRGPFSAQKPGGDILSLQLFLCVISVPLLCLAVLLEERRRVGESLRETTTQLTRTEAFSLVMVTNVGLDGRWLKVPPTLCELLGYSEEELLAGYFKDVTHPDDFEAELLQCQRLIKGEIRSFDLEKRYIHKDGRTVWVYLNCSVVTDALGRHIHFLTYIKDITERRIVEEALRESEEKYRGVVESQTELICRYLPDTTLTFVNDPYCRYFGKTREELIGVKFLELIPEPTREITRAHIESLVENPRVEINEHEALLPDGGIGWQQWIDHAIFDASGKVVELQAIGRDITERKKTEVALRKSEEALRESYDRIEDLAGRLIAAQEEERSHIARELHDDLNQQVAALAIGISSLKRRLPDTDAAVHKQIVDLREKTDWLSERIRQVSHELHSSILQHAGLPAALNSYCAEFSDREGIAVTLDIQCGIEAVVPDAALCLYRVAQESLRNIARHSGARSAVVTLAGVKGAIELRVADNGVGFDLAKARERRGLGLVSMEERVKLLHGSLVITTRPGAGTELKAQIPLRREDEQNKSPGG